MGALGVTKLRIPSWTRIIIALLNITLNNKTCTKYNNFFKRIDQNLFAFLFRYQNLTHDPTATQAKNF